MAVRTVFSDDDKLFYVTFTCFDWLPLIEITNSYDIIYNWFRHIQEKYDVEITGYAIMPNHIHCILSLPHKGILLNKVMAEGKIYMARKILDRLKRGGEVKILEQLKEGVTASRHKKGQQYIIFRRGFDAKVIRSKKFLLQKIGYIHQNPVRGNYNLVEDWRDYPHSSAAFYEYGNRGYFKPVHYDELS